MPLNVLGQELEPCGIDPLTGFFRDGSCNTDERDLGSHTICAVMSQEFLDHQTNIGNDGRVPPGMPLNILTNSGGNKFRAYDKATGDTVWETELAAGTTGPPVTYMFGDKQYIVVAIGDDESPAELVAFSLP